MNAISTMNFCLAKTRGLLRRSQFSITNFVSRKLADFGFLELSVSIMN